MWKQLTCCRYDPVVGLAEPTAIRIWAPGRSFAMLALGSAIRAFNWSLRGTAVHTAFLATSTTGAWTRRTPFFHDAVAARRILSGSLHLREWSQSAGASGGSSSATSSHESRTSVPLTAPLTFAAASADSERPPVNPTFHESAVLWLRIRRR